MEFDFKEIFSNMLSTAKNTAAGEWKQSKDILNQFFEFNKTHLELIARQYLNGDIDKAKFEYRLNELKENFELQLLALKVVAKVAAQNAANAAIDIFEKAVKMAIFK